MVNYILKNIKKNLRKFVVMLLMLTICTTVVLFTLEIVFNLIYEMSLRASDIIAQDDLESMIMMLIFGVILLISFVVIIVDNTYSVVLFGRENEFILLNRLGYYRQRIKRMLEGESVIICSISCCIGIVLSKILSLICMSRFDLMSQKSLPLTWYMLYYLALVVGMILIVQKDFNKISIDLGAKIKYVVNEKKEKNSVLAMVIGLILIFSVIVLQDSFFEQFVQDNAELCKSGMLIVGISLLTNEILILSMKFLLWVSIKGKFNALYIAITQNLYNYKKIKSVVNSIIIAVAFFVGFQGLYASIEETTRKYVNESVNYDKLIVFDDVDLPKQERIVEILEELKKDDSRYSIALTLVLFDDEEHSLTLTGIDESYYEMQRFYIEENSDINTIYNEGDSLQVMFSSKAAADHDYVIGDVLSQYRLKDKQLEFQISALYDPINLKQAFTSRKELSKYLWGNENTYNAIFIDGYTEGDIERFMKYFGDVSYDIYNMREYAEECVDQATNGTEMIEIILYVSMFFVTALVINLFILSYSDRKKQYVQLQILGMKKDVILKSMFIESGMIYVLGAVMGVVIAIPCIQCMLILVRSALVFETVQYIPYPLVIGILVVCFSCVMLFTYIIGTCSLKQDIKEQIREH